jgi:two-component system chemotaxis response regulator CheY
MLSSYTYDLLLTDINMPIMDGLKLISLLRKDAQYNALPIIVITTEGASIDRERATALGANEYLAKPIQTARIIEAARQLLDIEN